MLDQKGERIRLSHILIKAQVTSYDLNQAKQFLDSIRTLIMEKSITFEEAVNKFSEDDESKNQGGLLINPQTGNSSFEIGQLDKSAYFAIDKLVPGDISKPTLFASPDGEQAYRIILLRSESQPHVANLKDDYYKIKAAALQQKQESEMEKWAIGKLRTTYVWLADDYNECPNMKLWYQKQASNKDKL